MPGNSLMKLLLTSNSSSSSLDRAPKGAQSSDMDEDDSFRLSSYIHKSCGYNAKNNIEEIADDHTYNCMPNLKPDFVFSKPMRTLFVHPSNDSRKRNEDEDIDVESTPIPLAPVYDFGKAAILMDECERHVNFQHPDDGNPDWEDYIPRLNWSNMQARLFNKVVRVLHNDRLARLAHNGSNNEPVLRRVTVDKTARRLRQIFASVAWNIKYTQWLHNILMDNLHASYLVSYLDAIQTLKSKVPTLVERMLAASSTRSALATPTHELLSIVHKRPWDPLSSGITRYKPRKLPRDPILVMVPSGPGSGNTSSSRTHHWMANLSALGTVVCVYSTPGRVVGKTSVSNCLDHMLAATRAKVGELHADYGDKPIVLVGIGSGATLACQVALVENVSAVVCLGFPLHTVADNRGTPDDALLNIQVPVLFVVGQNASTCSVDDLEDLRDKLNVVTSLVLVGGADDHLRLSKAKKKLDGVTQTIVDKCIMDEVADFLGTLLSPDYVPPVRPPVVHPVEPSPKRTVVKTIERKRKCDIVIQANPDAVPHVPAKKGRKPKISMMQKMVQNKWANQLPMTSSEVPRSPVVASVAPSTPPSQGVTLSMSGSGKQIVLDKKGLQQLSGPGVAVSLASTKTPLRSTGTEGGTITVVAASSPTLTAAATVKGRLASGQLTSLSSILQPGTRGVLTPGTRTVTIDDKLMSRGIASSSTPVNIVDELNILDMPVILGDQNPDDAMLAQPQPQTQQMSPVKFILTNSKPRGKQGLYLSRAPSQQTVKCTKIYISKSDGMDHKTLFVNKAGRGRAKPRIRHIPATKHSQFY